MKGLKVRKLKLHSVLSFFSLSFPLPYFPTFSPTSNYMDTHVIVAT